MGGGVFKSKAPVSSSFRSGGATEVGTEKKVQSYKEYAKKMFGGGFSTHDYRQAPPLTGGAVLPDRPTRGVKIPKVVGHAPLTGGPGFQPTEADDRGYAGGGRARRISNTKVNPPKITPRPKGKPKIKKTIKKPAFTPTKADDRGM